MLPHEHLISGIIFGGIFFLIYPSIGFLGLSLLVPKKTLPSAIVGFPYEVDPRSTFHLMFLPVLTSHVEGRFLIGENIVRQRALRR